MFKASDQPTTNKTHLIIDWRLVSLLLVAALAVCMFLWKPWVTKSSTARKITVSGEATIKATPDQYQLGPYFEFTGDHKKAVTDAATMATQVSAKLKEIGVKDTEIKSSTSSYDKYMPMPETGATEENLQLSYTITLTNKDTAQKVQDYFLNTAAKGQISPYPTFSESKQKQLEAEAREKAIDDAKSKASKSAGQIDAKLGKVVTISDGSSSGGCGSYGLCAGANLSVADSSEGSKSSIPVQSGQNEFSSSVQVEYELR